MGTFDFTTDWSLSSRGETIELKGKPVYKNEVLFPVMTTLCEGDILEERTEEGAPKRFRIVGTRDSIMPIHFRNRAKISATVATVEEIA